jgi:hypothetical protein
MIILTPKHTPMWMTALLCAGLCAGCSARDPIPAATLLNHGNCTITEPGIRLVSYEDVARLRGSKLLNMTTAQVNQGPDLVLLAISKGRQPSPGYQFDLIDAFIDDHVATIELRWLAPDEDTVQAQMTTQPCIVIGLERGTLTEVRAIDEQANLIGELTL